MLLEIFLKGILIGFLVAAPIGPIAILCIKRTIDRGYRHGLSSGLGAATADSLYAAAAGLSLTVITSALSSIESWIRLGGGVTLTLLGIWHIAKFIINRKKEASEQDNSLTVENKSPMRNMGGFLSTLGLTLTNPATIIVFTALFSGYSIVTSDNSIINSAMLVPGVFTGSLGWWFILVSIAALARKKLPAKVTRSLSFLSGFVLAGFGIFILVPFFTGG
jgi:threonine/homoserine/homoserine lactone efflux protein